MNLAFLDLKPRKSISCPKWNKISLGKKKKKVNIFPNAEFLTGSQKQTLVFIQMTCN